MKEDLRAMPLQLVSLALQNKKIEEKGKISVTRREPPLSLLRVPPLRLISNNKEEIAIDHKEMRGKCSELVVRQPPCLRCHWMKRCWQPPCHHQCHRQSNYRRKKLRGGPLCTLVLNHCRAPPTYRKKEETPLAVMAKATTTLVEEIILVANPLLSMITFPFKAPMLPVAPLPLAPA
ncbi:hypothetical protein RIF29_34526 [Crotalaria pallida]|uniref:Uncharacterized protein n=1 Tax=Crotalaria pallida TaxID=3830 RepID=A0AAN9E9H5_CROPI